MRHNKIFAVFSLWLLMVTSSFCLSTFSFLDPYFKSIGIHNTAGMITLSTTIFSLMLWIAYIFGHNEYFARRPRKGVIFAQLCLIVPQILLYFISARKGIILLHAVQGIYNMQLGLLAIQLGKTSSAASERSLLLGFLSSGLPFGGMIGALFSGYFVSTFNPHPAILVTALVMIIGFIMYLYFSPSSAPETINVSVISPPKVGVGYTQLIRAKNYDPILISTGLILFSWSFIIFSIFSFFVPFWLSTGHSAEEVGTLMSIFGLTSIIGGPLGGYISYLSIRRNAADEDNGAGNPLTVLLRHRMISCMLPSILVFFGALLFVFHFENILVYYVGMALMGLFTLGMPSLLAIHRDFYHNDGSGLAMMKIGFIGTSAAFLGPLMSLQLIMPLYGWHGVWIILSIAAAIGVCASWVSFRYANVFVAKRTPPLGISAEC